MPPSGYSNREVGALREFLSSCSQALKRESALAGRSLSAGLEREIQHIRGVSGDSTPFSRAVLELTERFYVEVLRALQQNCDYDAAVQETLRHFEDEVSSIHVPS